MTAIFPKLEGLDGLARRDGVDIRPTLVRVLTDLYVQKPAHSAEEERHYTELALRLIDSVDLPTRVVVAKDRLCGRAAGGRAAPRARRDRGRRAGAAPLRGPLLHGPRSIVRDFGWAHAAIIATKRALPAGRRVMPRAPTPAAQPRSREIPSSALAELFFSAESAARRMLLSASAASSRNAQSVQPVETNRALEERRSGAIAPASSSCSRRALGLSQQQADASSATNPASRCWLPPRRWRCRRSRCSAC